jgi:hypothetical protein
MSVRNVGESRFLASYSVSWYCTSRAGRCLHLKERMVPIEWEAGWILETLWTFGETEKSFALVGNRRIVYIRYVNVVLHVHLVCTSSKYSAADFMHAFSAMFEYIAENSSPDVVSMILLHHSSMSSYILKIFNFGNMKIYTLSNKSNKVSHVCVYIW